MKTTKIFLYTIMSLLVIAMMSVMATAILPSFVTAISHNGTDSFYYEDQTVYFFVNVSGINASDAGHEIYINCTYTNGTVSDETDGVYVSGNNETDTTFMFTCPINYSNDKLSAEGGFTPITPGNFTVVLINGTSINFTTVSSVITLYNMTTPPGMGLESTNFSTLTNFDITNLTFVMVNASDDALGKMEFKNVNLSDIGQKLPYWTNNMEISIPTSANSGTGYIWVNSTFFIELDVEANLTIYNLPFLRMPDILVPTGICTSSGEYNCTKRSYSTTGSYGNLSFYVGGFSQYNMTDASDPYITVNLPTNHSNMTDTTPFINITFNGTGTQIKNASIAVTVTGTNGSAYTYNNMTCVYEGTSELSVTCSFSTLPLTGTEETYTLSASVSDFGGTTGNSNTSATYTFTVDNIAPSVTFEAPGTGAYTNDNDSGIGFNVTSTLVGVNLSSFSVNLSDTLYTGSGNFSCVPISTGLGCNVTQTTQELSEGNNYIKITAEDGVGNSVTSSMFNFTVDVGAPIVTLITGNALNTTSTNGALLFNVTDAVDSTLNCTLYINDTINSTAIVTSGTAQVQINTSAAMAEGVYEWDVECGDDAGSKANATAAKQISVDTTAPVMRVESVTDLSIDSFTFPPVNNFYMNNSPDTSVLIGFSDNHTKVRDAATVIDLYVNGTLLENDVNETDSRMYAGGFSANLYQMGFKTNVSPADGAVINVVASVEDYAGNTGTYNMTYTTDITAPSVSAPALTNSTPSMGGNVTMQVTITDALAGLNYTNATLNIVNYSSAPAAQLVVGTVALAQSGSTFSWSNGTGTLPSGTYTLNGTITAVDNAYGDAHRSVNTTVNNRTVSVNLNFTVTDIDTPTLWNVSTNYTSIIANRNIIVTFWAGANDTGQIDKIWAQYTNGTDSSTVKCTITDTNGLSVEGRGSCVVNATSSFSVSVYANDTSGTTSSASTVSFTVEDEAVEVSSMEASPATVFADQIFTINTSVFSFFDAPTVYFNFTNATNTSKPEISVNTVCTINNVTARTYSCVNGSVTPSWFAGTAGTSTTMEVASATDGTVTETSFPTAQIVTVYTNTETQIESVPAGTTISFPSSGTTFTGTTGLVNISNTTQILNVENIVADSLYTTFTGIDPSAGLNVTLAFRNFSTLNATAENTTGVAASIGSSTVTSVFAVFVVDVQITNEVGTNLLGATNRIQVNCTKLNVTCTSSTVAYKRAYNITADNSSGSWTSVTTSAWGTNMLNLTTDGFSIFALATPVAAVVEDTSSSSSSSSSTSSGWAPGQQPVITEIAKVQQQWDKINADTETMFKVQNVDIAVDSIEFILDRTMTSPYMMVRSLSEKPVTIQFVPSTKVYQYIEFEHANIEPSLAGAAVVNFRVSKAWLAANALTEDDVMLYRYVNRWTTLKPSVIDSDTQYVYFTTSTPGFSYFAIGGIVAPEDSVLQEGVSVEPTSVDEVEEAGETAPTTGVEEEVAPPVQPPKKKTGLVVTIVIIVVVLLLILLIFSKKRKKVDKHKYEV